MAERRSLHEAATIEDCETASTGRRVSVQPLNPLPHGYSGAVVHDLSGSPTVPDSLNSSVTEPIVSPNRELNKGTAGSAFEESVTTIHSSVPDKLDRQPYYGCREDSDTSTTDSLEEANSYLQTLQDTSSDGKQKVVGILKKTNKPSFISHYNRARLKSAPQAAALCSSNETLDQEDSKLPKRVRFSDQVGMCERSSSPKLTNITDSVQIELWKRVFPKELSQESVRNSAFTPRMKCSLSSKPAGFQPPLKALKRPSNGKVSVYVPNAAIEDYVAPINNLRMPCSTGPGNSSSVDQTMEVRDLSDSSDSSNEGTGSELAVLKSLDRTPTDTEINSMWDQIRQCLQDERKMPVPPRIFNFKPPIENGRQTLTNRTVIRASDRPLLSAPVNTKLLSKTSTTVQPSNARKTNMNYTTRKQLVYRQPNQSGSGLMRSRNDVHSRPVEATRYAIPVRQEAGLNNRLLLSIHSSSKEPAKSSGTSKCKFINFRVSSTLNCWNVSYIKAWGNYL